MNYPFLIKIFPSYFKVVGYGISLISIACAVFYKINSDLFPDSISLRVIQTILLASLFFIIASKSKNEDERTSEIRIITATVGFFLIILFVITMEVLGLSTGFISSHRDFSDICLVYLLSQTLLFEIFSRTTLIDKMESNKEIFSLLVVIAFVFLFFFNKWFWEWTYPSIVQ